MIIKQAFIFKKKNVEVEQLVDRYYQLKQDELKRHNQKFDPPGKMIKGQPARDYYHMDTDLPGKDWDKRMSALSKKYKSDPVYKKHIQNNPDYKHYYEI